jgi:chemotaxis protein CheY-P-specific phosphatase CheC
VVKLPEKEKEVHDFEKEMLEQILKTTASKSMIYLQFFIGRVIKINLLSIHWLNNAFHKLNLGEDFVISRIELREQSELVGSIFLIFPFTIAHQLAKDLYGDLIPEISQKHVLDLVEEMTNIISAPLSEASTFFPGLKPVIPSIARIVSYEDFKSLLVAQALVLELKMGGKMEGTMYFVMEEGTVKKLRRMLKMRERE